MIVASSINYWNILSLASLTWFNLYREKDSVHRSPFALCLQISISIYFSMTKMDIISFLLTYWPLLLSAFIVSTMKPCIFLDMKIRFFCRGLQEISGFPQCHV